MNRHHVREPSSETPFDTVFQFVAEFAVFVLLVAGVLGAIVIAWAGTR